MTQKDLDRLNNRLRAYGLFDTSVKAAEVARTLGIRRETVEKWRKKWRVNPDAHRVRPAR